MRKPKQPKQEPRWHVVAEYGNGRSGFAVNIEELDELSDVIEGGPDWTFLDQITITLNRE